MVASVPLETSRTFSMLGTAALSRSASSTSPGVGAPNDDAPLDGVLHGGDHARVRVPEDHRSPGLHVIDVGVPVDVGDGGASSANEERRHASDGTERADRRVHAAGDDPAGAIEQVLGPGHVVKGIGSPLRYAWPSRPPRPPRVNRYAA